MQEQNYKNHPKLTPVFHIVLPLLILCVYILAVIDLTHYLRYQELIDWITPAALLLASLVMSVHIGVTRYFSTKLQDRIIRSEENFRHFILTGKPLDAKLTMKQIIALRFASDEEFQALAQKAVAEKLDNKTIKRSIKSWRGDYHRV